MKATSKISARIVLIATIAILGILSCNRNAHRQSFIDAPFKKLEPKFEIFEIDNQQGDTLELSMGTRVYIPANAFVDSLGNLINGKVNISYREFKNAAEIFMAGIPMNFDAFGQHTALETAGMFEIRANSGKQTLKLDTEKAISIKMGSRVEGPNFNFFGFDETDGQWKLMGYPEMETNVEYAKIVENIEKLSQSRKHPLDENFFVFNYNAAFDVTYYDLGVKLKNNTIKKRIESYGASLYTIHTYEPVQYRGREYQAQFMLWRNLSKTPMPRWTKKEYINATLKALGNDVYRITVSDHKNNKFQFNASIEMPLQLLYAYKPEYLKENYEKAMQQLEIEKRREETEAKVFRSFQMAKLGVFNFDCLYKPLEPENLMANFTVKGVKNDFYNNGKIYYIPGSRRSIITLRQFDNNQIIFDKADETAMYFTILPGDSIATIDYNQLESATRNKQANSKLPNVNLEFKPWNKSIKEEADVLALFGIE